MKMKIIQVTDEAIVFGNGNKITYDHVVEQFHVINVSA